MPCVAHVARARALGIMDSPLATVDGYFPAVQAQTAADIDVLVVEEESLVETPDSAISAGSEQHEHAGDPVGCEQTLLDGVVDAHRPSQGFAENQRGRGQSPRAVLRLTTRIPNRRRDDRERRVRIHVRKQTGENVPRYSY